MRASQRIDHLPADRRLTGLSAKLLSAEQDEVLQQIVVNAAEKFGAPIALVSLVLDEIQFFRAHHGLPPELAQTQAAARDMSFCQLVVRDDDILEVRDATLREEIPQALVDIYGIRSYLGAPVHLNGQPLGSLCVVDVRPRTFTEQDRSALRLLAAEVDARISCWTETDTATTPMPMVRDAVAPIFAEMRNHLSPLVLCSDELRILAVELRAHIKAMLLSGPAHAVLPDFDRYLGKLDLLDTVASWADSATSGLLSGIRIAEQLVDSRPGNTDPQALMGQVDGLSKHLTDSVGGLSWDALPEGFSLDLTQSEAAIIISSILNRLVLHIRRRRPMGVRAALLHDGQSAVVVFSSEAIHADDGPALVDESSMKRAMTRGLAIDSAQGVLRVRLPTT